MPPELITICVFNEELIALCLSCVYSFQVEIFYSYLVPLKGRIIIAEV